MEDLIRMADNLAVLIVALAVVAAALYKAVTIVQVAIREKKDATGVALDLVEIINIFKDPKVVKAVKKIVKASGREQQLTELLAQTGDDAHRSKHRLKLPVWKQRQLLKKERKK